MFFLKEKNITFRSNTNFPEMFRDVGDMRRFDYQSPLDDCFEEKLELERKLAVALGLLASCQLELSQCGKEGEDNEAWWNRVILLSSIR